jgi:hypothetical protein
VSQSFAIFPVFGVTNAFSLAGGVFPDFPILDIKY